MYKDLTFSSFLVVVDEVSLNEAQFYESFELDTEIELSNNGINYKISISKEDSFAKIYIQFGTPFPRPDIVMNLETHESEENPRTSTQYEPKQEFGLIDFSKSTLWISNSKRKGFFIGLFKEHFSTTNVVVKNVYSEEDFINSIKKIEEIKFSAFPNLFSETSTLSKELTDEILGYGASVATLLMKFDNHASISDNLMSKIKFLLGKKETYKSLVITGRDSENFGVIFNNEMLSKRIPLKALINENEVFDTNNVFAQLIGFLKDA